MSAVSFERAKAILSQEQDGTSVYEHLTKIVMHLNKGRPENAKLNFEDICTALKKSSFRHKPEGIPFDIQPPAVTKHQNAYARDSLPLMKTVAPSTWVQADLLEFAGVSIGRENSYLLTKKMQEISSEANGLRFWGKICGTQSDYFVVEGVLNEAPGGLDGNAQELPAKPGANENAFWVCSCPGGAFTKLPDAKPACLKVAAKIKKYFTGDLSKTIYSYPPFDGVEADLLRAQIQLISADCTIAPEGMYNPTENEDGDPDYGCAAVQGEDLVEVSADMEKLMDLAGWQHLALEISSLDGRCIPLPLPEDSDEDPPETKPALRAVSEDQEDEEKPPAWNLRTGKQGQVAVLRSTWWPGAVAVGVGGGGEGAAYVRFANVYVGYGVRNDNFNSFTLPAPPNLRPEYSPPEDTEETDYIALCIEHPEEILKKDPNAPPEEEGGDEE
jgi:radial spoke head protein 4A